MSAEVAIVPGTVAVFQPPSRVSRASVPAAVGSIAAGPIAAGGALSVGGAMAAGSAPSSRVVSARSALEPVEVRPLDSLALDAMPGAGPLTPLLLDPAVTDVLVNAGLVWIDRGSGLEAVDINIGGPADVRRLAQRMAAACGRRLDEACPYVDGRLPDGTRLHAVLPPVATHGPYLSLRTFRQRAMSLSDLVSYGTVSQLGAELMAAIVASRLPYLISGGTGSGKTTLLTTMLGLVPHSERIVIVEDAAELHPAHPHVASLQARTANVEGAGEVTLRDVMRQALRMRPDRLVVGECRGAEVIDLLGALNTGHEGGAATLHANAARDVPARLEALGLLSGVPREAVHAQIAAALQLVIHMRRSSTGRVVDEIVLLRASAADRLVGAVSAWNRLGGVRAGSAAFADLLASRGVRPPSALLAGAR